MSSLEPRNLTMAIKNIARACGDEISDAQPILDARLEDGSRVAALFPPCAVNGPLLTIRKFTHRFSLDELVAVGTVTPDIAELLEDAVATRRNLLISGGTGTGKTTLLNAIAAQLPDADRIVVIEDTSEIHLQKRAAPCFRSARKPHSRPSPSRSCCARPCGIARTASSSARSVAPRPLTCCKPSTPAISAVSARFTRTRPSRR